MLKKITLNGKEIEYNFEYKKVKNLNLRIKTDGRIYVSANRFISEKTVEEFMISRADLILSALLKFEKNSIQEKTPFFSEEELKDFIIAFCKEIYPIYKNLNIKFPEIKFKKMVSRWGSCHTKNNILTFNLNLIYADEKCVKYVVFHEFTHFIHPNHSKNFYNELEKVCPDWKEHRKALKKIVL